jgi:hypothetical protein
MLASGEGCVEEIHVKPHDSSFGGRVYLLSSEPVQEGLASERLKELDGYVNN